uniref:GPI alpha-1,4-mannosyltransferase I, catalytic subunit n=1 Tax=Triatoma infestans TaxID=30076 RepID=A0A161MRE4_TRIIF
MRLTLAFSCLASLTCVSGLCYMLFGNEFVHGSLLYHLKRFDIRHNYSVYFYLQYLSYKTGISDMTRYLMFVPQTILLLLLAIAYGSKRTIAFCEMCMAFVLVMFNSVVTCQYFVWYMSLLPLCLKDLNFSKKELFLVSNYWFTSQAAWLLPAYLLEFKSQDYLLYIWIQCLVFFWANIVMLTSLIRNYLPKLKVN